MSSTYINPFTDFGFKKIFGEEASKPHLIDFLNALLPAYAQIAELSFKNLEQLPAIEDHRRAVYDIYCRGENGEYFIVELQKVKQINFKDRALYYATFPIQDQAIKGDWDYRLKSVYCIGVLGFTFDDEKANQKEVVHTVKLKDQNNQDFYDKLTFIYLEMPNFEKRLERLETRLDKWLYFIKNLEDLQSIPELFKTEEAFLSAFETAKLANLEPMERERYQQSLKILRDNYSILKTAVDEADAKGEARGREAGLLEGEVIGREAGLLEGEAIGRESGKLETKLEIAKSMKAAGMTNAQIQAITGLSTDDLEKI
jgi:predicted transposase/invertase (TIGR01784 family)